MAAKKDITQYCFFRFNSLGNTVTGVNIFKSTSRADIVKQWKEKSGPDTSPIFKGFVPPMPKKKADPDTDFWTNLFGSMHIADQKKKSTKKSVKKGRK